jgi:hypothetical protein
MMIVPIALLLALPNAQQEAPPPPPAVAPAKSEGRSREQAIRVKSVDAEYAYLRAQNWKPGMQELIVDGKRAYDVLEVTDQSGATFKIWFDISGFYGKELGF